MENDEQLLEMLQGLPELINFAEKREELSERCVLLARELTAFVYQASLLDIMSCLHSFFSSLI